MSRTGLTIETFGGEGIPVNEPVVYIALASDTTKGINKSNATRNNGTTGQSGSVTDSASLSERLIKLKVTADTKRSSQAELTMWNEDLALLDTPIMQKGTVIKLSWGYSGYMSKVRTFKVHKIKGTTARVSNFGQLKIICLGQTYDMHGAVRSACYCDTTLVKLVRFLARRYGIPDSDIYLGPDDGKVQTFYQVNQTDAQFLQSLAQKLGWNFKLEDGELTFAPYDLSTRALPVAAYTYFTDEQGWIKRFEPTTNVMAIPGSVTVKSQDPISGKRVQFTQTMQNKKTKSLCKFTETRPHANPGANIVPPGRRVHRSKSALKPGVVPSSQVVNSPASSASQVKKEAEVRHKNAMLGTVKARLVIIGDPDIWSSSLLVLENVGKYLSGLHLVQKCIHYVDQRGFEIDCKIRREGVNTLGQGKRPNADQTAKAQRVARRLRSRVVGNKQPKNVNTTGVKSRTKFTRT